MERCDRLKLRREQISEKNGDTRQDTVVLSPRASSGLYEEVLIRRSRRRLLNDGRRSTGRPASDALDECSSSLNEMLMLEELVVDVFSSFLT
ncbi:hypothetical protein KIN20_006841 [Parelaphostrongylus tenuis]|uniref:Uncharacterized protein n=1 Tax=Parelaphostrongylus tenuis TaxID=148309 RepID=A0AAD5QGD2_PARTN|nr:hypothetical protein KIN20_006841 [Parelaphostrongylus tenuis]